MKKIFSVASMLVTLLVFSELHMAFAQTAVPKTYSDVNEQNKYAAAIYDVTKRGIVEGYPNGTYRPDTLINRAELLKIFILAAGNSRAYLDEIDTHNNDTCFPDIKANQWYTKYVCFAKSKGIVEGYPNGTYRPEQNINLVETLKIGLKDFDYYYEENSNPWFQNIVNRSSELNIIPLDFNSFGENVNRGQMADLIARIEHGKEKTLNEYLGFLKDYHITYDILDHGVNMDKIARSVYKLSSAKVAEYKKFNDPSGFEAVLYSDDAESKTDTGCSDTYYVGNFRLAVVRTKNGEPSELLSDQLLGFTKIPKDALFAKSMETTNGGANISFMMTEEYETCSNRLFSVRMPENFYKDLNVVEISDMPDNHIAAPSFAAFEFQPGTLKVTPTPGQVKTYAWQGNKFVYQATTS